MCSSDLPDALLDFVELPVLPEPEGLEEEVVVDPDVLVASVEAELVPVRLAS